MNQTLVELPKYKCHKIVHALKIGSIEYDTTPIEGKKQVITSAKLFPVEKNVYAPFEVDAKFVKKHLTSNETYESIDLILDKGYYVIYDDGYKSWSPVETFEDGYIIVPESGKEKPNDKETFSRFVELAKEKLSKEDFEKVYGTILPIADTILGFDNY